MGCTAHSILQFLSVFLQPVVLACLHHHVFHALCAAQSNLFVWHLFIGNIFLVFHALTTTETVHFLLWYSWCGTHFGSTVSDIDNKWQGFCLLWRTVWCLCAGHSLGWDLVTVTAADKVFFINICRPQQPNMWSERRGEHHGQQRLHGNYPSLELLRQWCKAGCLHIWFRVCLLNVCIV